MRRRVVVTGIGCVTPIGTSPVELTSGLTSGRIGVHRLTLFDASRFPVQIAAEVRDWDVSAVGLYPRDWRHAHRQTLFALGAGVQAAEFAGLRGDGFDRRRIGVYLGCGEPFEDFRAFIRAVHECAPDSGSIKGEFLSHGLRLFNPDVEREYEPDVPGLHLGELLDIQGPIANCVSACVSSTQAIGEAARMIRQDEVDVMLCGGAHSTIHPFGITGFHRLSALSTRNDDPVAAVRPFDADRDGFVVGEGGAIVVLEELEHARRRGAEILGELTGYGAAQDAYRVTDAHPEGRGAALAMQRALADAGLNPDDVDYINAHGTGTPLNDIVETRAIKRAFGAAADRIPVSSTKSMLGHATTACGAIELVVCLLSLRAGVIPPTLNHERPGPGC
ncbi:MAG: beta-ketoacyl-[acyl-carrier-protein] synthase family protein, partial [Planctomycetaceae bacterium]|nr:beta-ketoacyl-[acyl-carrier-protein] synthase family protein [Planctomycetaceae bacterium]